ncbi:MAG: methyltransferase domain-containing protein [Akkermansiaceae bacterium]|jgi:predicted methyltransferase|nr:methyltransferase domain-containing protein [Akkermansiaceae bacterium]MDP4646746.1 methyltransferase domain-containing protein [Akkermansiaceae bacterium]MDP4720567.1 methyltransferase domain-containing protein [Akkermansiaceae bacterium]MDP4779663.1 methyltransferase domain-containing protein [Akkermansiaceae bacterium]MDP4846679.1 methyltransferase domain-containing protein [Akkermansiaceae bacterium]
MSDFPPHPTDLLHHLLRDRISHGDTVIDATAGNGHDTLFLAGAVGETGRVIAIDIQEQAITSTRSRLDAAGLTARATLHHASHTQIREIASGTTPTVILFNLGYLPGADRSITTCTADSLSAIATSVKILPPRGILAITCYTGHASGEDESTAVTEFITAHNDLRNARYGLIGTRNPAPFLLLCEKRP